jgi:hypothetical protein
MGVCKEMEVFIVVAEVEEVVVAIELLLEAVVLVILIIVYELEKVRGCNEKVIARSTVARYCLCLCRVWLLLVHRMFGVT